LKDFQKSLELTQPDLEFSQFVALFCSCFPHLRVYSFLAFAAAKNRLNFWQKVFNKPQRVRGLCEKVSEAESPQTVTQAIRRGPPKRKPRLGTKSNWLRCLIEIHTENWGSGSGV